MIRVRSADGTRVTQLPEFRFVELCDDEGRVALLVHLDANGEIHLVRGGDDEATRYTRAFPSVEFITKKRKVSL